MKMGYSSYFMGLFNFIKRYPETLLALSCFVFFRLWLQYRKRQTPINWPIFGMVPSLLLNIHRLHDWCSDALKASGSTFVFKGPWFVGMEILFTCDPDNVNHITKANFANYPKGADFLEIFDILGTGILASDSDLWKIQRKMTQIFVHNSKFREFSTVTGREKVEKGLIPIFQDAAEHGTVLDLQDVLQRFTFDATCILLFGIDPGNLTVGLPNFVFPHAIHELEEACFYRYIVPKFVWKTLRWLNVGEERKLAKSWVIIDEFLHNCIANRREALAKAKMGKEKESGDLLTSFMDYPLEDESSVTKTEKFLRDTAVNMLVAGKDTTFSALIWFFWLLSKNPAVEAKLLDELLKHFPEMASKNTPELFDTDRLAVLPYLQAALSESLRLYPPGHIVHRGVAETEILPNGTEVRPGMQVMYNIYAMGRMETLWGPDCLEFKPERWISEKGTVKYISPYKFMSFNSGPRSCLGKEVAYTLLKAAVAPLLFYFKIQVVEGQGDVRPSISVTLPVKNGLMVKVKKRDLTQVA